MTRRFLFLVHPLNRPHRRIMGLRARKWSLSSRVDPSPDTRDIGRLCRFRLGDDVMGEIHAIPLLPEELLGDQDLALQHMHSAVIQSVRSAGIPDAVGLGSLCAVTAGRGRELQKKLSMPVTTGAAATAWTLSENALHHLNNNPGRTAILGSGSPVGMVVAERLHQSGWSIIVDSKKTGSKLNCSYVKDPNKTVADCSLVIGCGPTGPVVNADALAPNATLLDVAIPHSIIGKAPRGVSVCMGEAMIMPKEWRRGFWGPWYHLVSGYGWGTILACVVEPLAIVTSKRGAPFAQGRTLSLKNAMDFGEEARRLGFEPVIRKAPVLS